MRSILETAVLIVRRAALTQQRIIGYPSHSDLIHRVLLPVWVIRLCINHANGFRDKEGYISRKCTRICVEVEWKRELANPPSTLGRDSNLDLPVIGSLFNCENSVLDHAAIEADLLADGVEIGIRIPVESTEGVHRLGSNLCLTVTDEMGGRAPRVDGSRGQYRTSSHRSQGRPAVVGLQVQRSKAFCVQSSLTESVWFRLPFSVKWRVVYHFILVRFMLYSSFSSEVLLASSSRRQIRIPVQMFDYFIPTVEFSLMFRSSTGLRTKHHKGPIPCFPRTPA
ncbi:unnamed protein product [Timema podura]|uniref:Uncharacterized protein n=1 Tax=Timema podura TaxID=61482 RepID=A0ABN7NJP6_TIMPD|nr:unnamed protein product [Timema podura]